jgi:hypothetical protein
MAYACVAQAEHETLYNDGNNALQAASPISPTSPVLPELSHRPLSLTFEEMSGAVAVIDPTAKDSNNGSEGVGKILKSLSASSHSYEMVEGDEYEDMVATPRRLHFHRTSRPESNAVNTEVMSEQAPVRTASVSRHLPLNHPTPDLQALQGGYIKNVERLEESAERLSITSSLDDELPRRRGVERRTSAASSKASRNGARSRQFSTSSFSNSIIGVNREARNGGY